MTMSDRRLIEDYMPVDWLSAEASGEPRTKGHISTLHLWRARRPLVACRAAIYSALVSAPETADERERQDRFLKSLCQWGTPENVVRQARRNIRRNRDEALASSTASRAEARSRSKPFVSGARRTHST